MNVTTKIKMDLSMPDFCMRVNAVQGDAYSRSLSIVLYNRVLPWIIPEGITVAVRYAKPDGTKGYYDTLPDGTPAWSCRDNVLTVQLAPQMLTVAGQVKAQIELVQGIHILSTFSMTVEVEENPAAGVTTSEDYINWLQWIREQCEKTDVYTKIESDAKYAAAIIQTAGGTTVHVSDSAAAPIQNLKFFGKTVQNGAPSIDSPVPLENAGKGSFSVYVGTAGSDENVQILTIHTPNGLPGIPVVSGGNYTDSNQQQWICDEVDFKKGIYTQRVQTICFDGSEDEGWVYDGNVNRIFSPILVGEIQVVIAGSDKMNAQCNCLAVEALTDLFNNQRNGIGITTNGTISMIWHSFTSLAAWKEHMRVNPVVLQYVLANPVFHKLQDMGLTEWEHISPLYSRAFDTTVSNDADMDMEITYVADTAMYIEKMISKYHSQNA